MLLLYQAGEEPTPPERAPADPKGWKLGGLPVDPESEAYIRRHKHPGGGKFSLSSSLKARLPKFDRAGLDVVRDFVSGKDKSLPFKFFEEAFPKECQDIILNEVRNRLKHARSLRATWSTPCLECALLRKTWGLWSWG